MKKIVIIFRAILVTIIYLVGLYLIGLFLSNKFNPLEWSWFGKLVYLISNISVIVFYYNELRRYLRRN